MVTRRFEEAFCHNFSKVVKIPHFAVNVHSWSLAFLPHLRSFKNRLGIISSIIAYFDLIFSILVAKFGVKLDTEGKYTFCSFGWGFRNIKLQLKSIKAYSFLNSILSLLMHIQKHRLGLHYSLTRGFAVRSRG